VGALALGLAASLSWALADLIGGVEARHLPVLSVLLRMRELAHQLPPPARPRRARDVIRTELGKAPLRLTRGQAARPRAQMRQ
jgi:hypothetical protein